MNNIVHPQYPDPLESVDDDSSMHGQALITPAGDTDGIILETLTGVVNRIEGDTAHVTLRDSHGEESLAECDASELTAHGIGEGERFTCTVRESGAETEVSFSPRPRKVISKEQWRQLYKATRAALGNYDPRSDY